MSSTVLIADDDRAIVDVLAEALVEEGYHVRIAYDGRMALEAVDYAPTDLVITDIRMPRMNGLELVRRLRDRADPIPVVLMSAWPALEETEGILFVDKPFEIGQVLSVVATALSNRGGV